MTMPTAIELKKVREAPDAQIREVEWEEHEAEEETRVAVEKERKEEEEWEWEQACLAEEA